METRDGAVTTVTRDGTVITAPARVVAIMAPAGVGAGDLVVVTTRLPFSRSFLPGIALSRPAKAGSRATVVAATGMVATPLRPVVLGTALPAGASRVVHMAASRHRDSLRRIPRHL